VTKITRSNTENVIEKIYNRAIKILVRRFSYSKDEVIRFISALSEVCINVYEHSEDWGLVCVQAYQDGLRLAVSDLGIGIKNSLDSKYCSEKNWNDATAILKSMEEGVTRFNELERGGGLSIVKERVNKWRGYLGIYSGHGKVDINRHNSSGIAKSDVPYFFGTHISISLPKL
jgi:anti-sigma regulatory factor (Ser/Thr protein kinase)